MAKEKFNDYVINGDVTTIYIKNRIDETMNCYIDTKNLQRFLDLGRSWHNLMNRTTKNKNNKSGYRNVCWIEADKKWVVQLQINKKNTRLGCFNDVHEAGKFAEKMRQKYYGEYQGNA